MKELERISIIVSIALAIIFVFLTTELKQCRKVTDSKIDTITRVEIKEREIFIRDTIRIKSTAWKIKDSIIFLEGDSIPCGDTSFVAQSDSIIAPSGDTLNLAFSYFNRKGNFSLVFRPRPDSILVKEVTIPIMKEEPYPYGAIFGAFGIGTILGIVLMMNVR